MGERPMYGRWRWLLYKAEDEKGPHHLKGSLTPEKAKGGGEELLLQRRVPGRSNDEAPKHNPNSGPSASHLYSWQPQPQGTWLLY